MKILIACEESQAVTKEFRLKGHEAYSCDLLPCSGGHPEQHFQDDVWTVMNRYPWEMVIAFPPCTHLAVSGAKHFEKKRADGRQQEAIKFFLLFPQYCLGKGIPMIVENPIGIMSTLYRKPDQIIQPWQFGHSVNKATCLWLKDLPLLKPTNIVPEDETIEFRSGKKMSKWFYETSCLPPKERGITRSKTFPGIAAAMADQWG